MRAIWSGNISFGLVNIPIDLFPAVKANELSFHFLHEKDSGRIHNERVCEICGKVVPYSDIVKGYEYEKGKVVSLYPEDFENIGREEAKTIHIFSFVELSEVDFIFYDKPYYLTPHKNGGSAYILLREALKQTGKAGIAKFVFRTRENLALVHAKGPALMLQLLHFEHEVKYPSEFNLPAEKAKIDKKEISLAVQLVENMATAFQPKKYKDTYEEELLDLIHKKMKGKVPKKTALKPASNVIDLMSKLKASLEQKNKTSKRKTA